MEEKYIVFIAIDHKGTKPLYEVSVAKEHRTDKRSTRIDTVETYFSNFPPDDPDDDFSGIERFAAHEIRLNIKDPNPSKEKLKHLAWYAFWWKLFTETEKHFK